MTTLEMMNMARVNNRTYRSEDMLYNTKFGFHDKKGQQWEGRAFEYLNNLFAISSWEEDDTIYMTKSEAEKKYGIKIIN